MNGPHHLNPKIDGPGWVYYPLSTVQRLSSINATVNNDVVEIDDALN